MTKGMYFADLGTEIVMILDEKMPDDTNVIVKMKGSSVELYINPNRLYNTLNNKDAIVGSLNKKLSQLIEEFRTKISLKKLEEGKFWDVLINDIVYDKMKHTDHIYLREAEKILGAVTRMMLQRKEIEEGERLIEKGDLEKVQEKIDNDKKKKKQK